MEQEALKVLVNLGISGLVIFFGAKYGIKALEKLYNDMREQHKEQLQESIKREDKLMEYLDKKNETDSKVAQTLDSICNEMGCMSRRIEDVEKSIRKDEAV